MLIGGLTLIGRFIWLHFMENNQVTLRKTCIISGNVIIYITCIYNSKYGRALKCLVLGKRIEMISINQIMD